MTIMRITMAKKNESTTLACWLWLSLCWTATVATLGSTQDVAVGHKSPFKIILDGGSTGSRLHIFEFVEDNDNQDEVTCVRRGSSRANTPLSAFGRLPSEVSLHKPLNATFVAEHLLPLFEYAAEVIPAIYHATTSVQYQATAGMRLLLLEEQEAVYDALYQGLMESPSFVFTSMKRQDIATLSGELEGFYGAVAANYLQGIVNARLCFTTSTTTTTLTNEDSYHHRPVGALDMGGSSTQIVFLPDAKGKRTTTVSTIMSNNNSMDDPQQCPNDYPETCQASNFSPSSQQQHLKGDHFFSTSYLSYGVDQFRERLWSTLVAERRAAQVEDEHVHDDGIHDSSSTCINRFIPNPCANRGYQVEWEGFVLLGTGNTEECIRQTQRLIPHPEIPLDLDDEYEYNNESSPQRKRKPVVGGVEHPPVRGKFLAMSLYYFSLDSLRVFSEPNTEAFLALNLSWPTPSIQELYNALDGLCSRNWHGDMELQHDAHPFTRPEVLPHRCIETVYMVTLLKDGFGFDWESRDITFTFLVDGTEVEWTLGMALAMYAEETAVNTAITATTATTAIEMQQPESSSSSSLEEQINVTYQDKDIRDDDVSFRFQSTAHPLFLAESLGL